MLFRGSEDWKELSRLILSQGRSLVAQGRYQTLLEWLGTLPKEVLDTDPWLLYWKGVCLIPFSPAESRARFEEALHSFDARREARGVFLSWAGVVESIITPVDNFTPLDAWISVLPNLLEKYGGLPSGEVGDEVTCWMFRALSYWQYPRDAVELWTPRALAVVQTTMDRRLKFMLTLGILVSFQITKDTREAERIFASLRETLKQPDATPLMRLSVDALEAVLSGFDAPVTSGAFKFRPRDSPSRKKWGSTSWMPFSRATRRELPRIFAISKPRTDFSTRWPPPWIR